MPEIVNLRLARKTRERSRKEAQAEQNRTTFGRTKADRRLAELERARAERELDGRRLPPDPGSLQPTRPYES
jgi:hypothetical protein